MPQIFQIIKKLIIKSLKNSKTFIIFPILEFCNNSGKNPEDYRFGKG